MPNYIDPPIGNYDLAFLLDCSAKYAPARRVWRERYAVLAAVGVPSLLTLIYVMRAFMRVWWQPRHQQEKVKPYGDSLLAPTCLIVLCIIFGAAAEPLLQISQKTAAWVTQPASYVAAVNLTRADGK